MRFWKRKKEESFRQGDVMFKLLKKLPEGVERVGDVLRIEGEGTGHFHQMKRVEVHQPKRQVAVAERPQVIWLVEVPKEGAVITHEAPVEEKHPDLSLPPGIYRVEQTREYQNPRPVD